MSKKQLIEFLGTGRRKTAVASVRLRKGTGGIKINGKTLAEYFPLKEQQNEVINPLKKLDLVSAYDMIIRVEGGGIEGQVIAARLGIARALVVEDEDRKPSLKEAGYVTRDPRKKERKKYGRAKARKKFQFSKR